MKGCICVSLSSIFGWLRVVFGFLCSVWVFFNVCGPLHQLGEGDSVTSLTQLLPCWQLWSHRKGRSSFFLLNDSHSRAQESSEPHCKIVGLFGVQLFTLMPKNFAKEALGSFVAAIFYYLEAFSFFWLKCPALQERISSLFEFEWK